MNILSGVYALILNYFFLTFVAAWASTVLLKSTLIALKDKKKFSLKDGFSNGGMPSSHSAIVSSLTMALLLRDGFSELFFVSLIFSSIVISDAYRLRQNVGLQGEKINLLLEKNKEKPIHIVYGHTFLQVIAGIFMGVLCASILNFVI